MRDVVEVRGLTKRYGAARGVEDLSFQVRRGEVFGFLGPNGAGKTTTMRILLDLLRPTEGEARVFGLDSREGSVEIRARTGYLPGELAFHERLTAREQLVFSARLRGGRGLDRVEGLAARFGLELDRPIRALSRGNKQKVGLVQALMHDPELVIMDEPTSGLDPLLQQAFHDVVGEIRREGRTVLLSSHVLPEVEKVCDRVGIIREGRLVVVEPVGALKSRAMRRVEARFRGPADPARLTGVPGVQGVAARGNVLTCEVRGETGPLVRALAGEDLVDLVTRESSLEDAFLDYYGGGSA